MEQNKSCITINCGCCNNKSDGGSSSGNGDGAPVGTVISYMGTKAPQHYLICDGVELNIEDYPQLSQQIKEEFGAVDFFGGNGIQTFAVPDLRNEFLRGYHGGAEEKLSGEIGRHQNATDIPTFQIWKSTAEICFPNHTLPPNHIYPTNYDSTSNIYARNRFVQTTEGTNSLGEDGLGMGYTYTSRPNNTAVLFCIRYE